MTNTTESSSAVELLNEFSKLGNIAPPPEWEQSVLRKIHASHFERKNGYEGLRLVTIISCFLFLQVPYLRNVMCETEYRRFPVLDNNGNSPGYLQV